MTDEKGQIQKLIELFNENKLDQVINECNIIINKKINSPIIF